MAALGRLVGAFERLDPQVVDCGTAVVLFAAAVVVGRLESAPLGAAGVVASGLTVASVAWRRRWPAVCTAAALAAAEWFRFLSSGAVNAVIGVALILDFYALGRGAPSKWWRSWQALLVGAAVPVVASGLGRWNGPTVLSVWAFFVVVPFAGGRVVDARSRLVAQLADEAQRAETVQLQRQARAAAEERTRIAREVHDVLAHSLSVIVIQAAAARRTAPVDVSSARRALTAVESSGRTALGELRRMVGVVQREDEVPPSIGIRQLSELLDNAHAAGLTVELHLSGSDVALPPAASLVVYRIVQEALTNCLKHAARAAVTVTVDVTNAEVHLCVVNDGGAREASDRSPEGSGHGLIGMRERAALCGGILEAGPLADGGFSVQARIPLAQSADT